MLSVLMILLIPECVHQCQACLPNSLTGFLLVVTNEGGAWAKTPKEMLVSVTSESLQEAEVREELQISNKIVSQ